MSFYDAHNFPFAVALVLMALLALSQIVGAADLLSGGDADVEVEFGAEFDGDGSAMSSAGGFLDGLMSVIGLGRVPFLIWLAALLFLFAGIGMTVQALAIHFWDGPLHAGLASAIAGVLAVPLNGALVRPLASLLPKDESSAVTIDSFIRRDAVIQTGSARLASPARAKVIDRYGRPHFVMVEPHDPTIALQEGETVMLVRRDGETFYAIQYTNPLLSPDDA